jgi:iron complex transport system substrate-binding protein
MKSFFSLLFSFLVVSLFIGCKKTDSNIPLPTILKNEVTHAKGFSLVNYEGYSVLHVSNLWPGSKVEYTYVLKEKSGKVPDSLLQYTNIIVPIQNIIVTSTTHIPSLQMLDSSSKLIGFPNLNYVSTEEVRNLIDDGKVKEIGNKDALNTEVILALQPDVFVGYGIDNNNKTLDNLVQNGIKVLYNGDWNETTPLGKAEWIKFFGALLGKQKEANEIFYKIEQDYENTLLMVKNALVIPTVMVGDMYQDKWYLPKGNSWGSILLNNAGGDYLWKETTGSGSLSLSFETVLDKALNADIWITSGQYGTLAEMEKANSHYSKFKAFQNKEVYTFCNKKGATGGVLYYELAPNRPDMVLKDIVKTLHPELLVGYEPFFFEKLK